MQYIQFFIYFQKCYSTKFPLYPNQEKIHKHRQMISHTFGLHVFRCFILETGHLKMYFQRFLALTVGKRWQKLKSRARFSEKIKFCKIFELWCLG